MHMYHATRRHALEDTSFHRYRYKKFEFFHVPPKRRLMSTKLHDVNSEHSSFVGHRRDLYSENRSSKIFRNSGTYLPNKTA
jgi:hypothetical protein